MTECASGPMIRRAAFGVADQPGMYPASGSADHFEARAEDVLSWPDAFDRRIPRTDAALRAAL